MNTNTHDAGWHPRHVADNSVRSFELFADLTVKSLLGILKYALLYGATSPGRAFKRSFSAPDTIGFVLPHIDHRWKNDAHVEDDVLIRLCLVLNQYLRPYYVVQVIIESGLYKRKFWNPEEEEKRCQAIAEALGWSTNEIHEYLNTD
ncbi:MAG TPA: hypothetical protein VEA18_04010 [Candidatus Kapabacteria bacterium]|nr:hypothetical protein [Candidatus Kapabacteria bacterium]